MKLSAEAKEVMDEGRKLFQHYHQQKFGRTIIDEFKLGRPDVGWWQIRRALKANHNNVVTDFEPLERAYAALTEKLNPLIFGFGFLLG